MRATHEAAAVAAAAAAAAALRQRRSCAAQRPLQRSRLGIQSAACRCLTLLVLLGWHGVFFISFLHYRECELFLSVLSWGETLS